MTELEVKTKIEDSILNDGICPEMITNEGFVMEGVSDICIKTNSANEVSGTVTIDLEDNEFGVESICGDFEIVDDNVKFGEFTPV